MYESPNQRDFARSLRTNQTEAEQTLWSRLRKRQLAEARFRRQYAIGSYIADFECFEFRLVIELDGGQHNSPEKEAYDEHRTHFLEQQGYRVIRFWNDDVMNDIDTVLEVIAREISKRTPGHPHPSPPPKGEGVK